VTVGAAAAIDVHLLLRLVSNTGEWEATEALLIQSNSGVIYRARSPSHVTAAALQGAWGVKRRGRRHWSTPSAFPPQATSDQRASSARCISAPLFLEGFGQQLGNLLKQSNAAIRTLLLWRNKARLTPIARRLLIKTCGRLSVTKQQQPPPINSYTTFYRRCAKHPPNAIRKFGHNPLARWCYLPENRVVVDASSERALNRSLLWIPSLQNVDDIFPEQDIERRPPCNLFGWRGGVMNSTHGQLFLLPLIPPFPLAPLVENVATLDACDFEQKNNLTDASRYLALRGRAGGSMA